MSLFARALREPHGKHLSQQEMVVIVPHFSMDSILLMSGSFGPFKPLRETSVPLWLALVFLRSKVCELKNPLWMSVENLQGALQYEKENPSFYPLPFYATEVCEFILDECNQSLEGTTVDLVGKLLGELMIIRWTKILRDLDVFKTTGVLTPGLRISNLTCIEIEKLRPVMLSLLNDGADMKRIAENTSILSYRSSASSSFEPPDYLSSISNSPPVSNYETNEQSPVEAAPDIERDFRRRNTL